MRRSRQSNLGGARRPGRACFGRAKSAAGTPRSSFAFTLIELIFVLALLAITASLVAAKMGSFFRGRALNFEARRLLSLTHYAQSRAVAEGVPVILWVNQKDSTYGLTTQSSFNDPDGDAKAVTYTAESSLTLEVPTGGTVPVSEQEDEKLGVTVEGLVF